jgi:hypothetical protein
MDFKRRSKHLIVSTTTILSRRLLLLGRVSTWGTETSGQLRFRRFATGRFTFWTWAAMSTRLLSFPHCKPQEESSPKLLAHFLAVLSSNNQINSHQLWRDSTRKTSTTTKAQSQSKLLRTVLSQQWRLTASCDWPKLQKHRWSEKST